jgi:hypothetical protein
LNFEVPGFQSQKSRKSMSRNKIWGNYLSDGIRTEMRKN